MLGFETALVVVGHAVTAMFGLVDAIDVDAEDNVRKNVRRCEVENPHMDIHGSDQREEDTLAVAT